jgi:hypothetical protein
VGGRVDPGVRGSWETMAPRQRLGAWALWRGAEAQERIPDEHSIVHRGAGSVKTLKPGPVRRRARGERRTNVGASVSWLETLQGAAILMRGRPGSATGWVAAGRLA